jgi:hypothetical protein
MILPAGTFPQLCYGERDPMAFDAWRRMGFSPLDFSDLVYNLSGTMVA